MFTRAHYPYSPAYRGVQHDYRYANGLQMEQHQYRETVARVETQTTSTTESPASTSEPPPNEPQEAYHLQAPVIYGAGMGPNRAHHRQGMWMIILITVLIILILIIVLSVLGGMGRFNRPAGPRPYRRPYYYHRPCRFCG